MLAKRSKLNLPTIKCRCGAEILVVANIKLMSQAIEAHVEEHKKKVKGHKEAEAETERIADDLVAKVLRKACEN